FRYSHCFFHGGGWVVSTRRIIAEKSNDYKIVADILWRSRCMYHYFRLFIQLNIMKTKTALLIELWTEARTRFTNQLPGLTADDLQKKLPPSPNSAGFLIRHIGDVELLFAKNVFGAQDVKVTAKTVIAQHDTGEWTNL